MRSEPWLPRAAAARPERVALATPEVELTYAELAARADACARRLYAAGVRAGDRVALELPPGVELVECFHACLRLGAAAMPIDPRLAAGERAARAASARLTLRAAPRGARDPDAPLLGEQDLAAVAAVIHTSGTSGAPKAVELTCGNLLWNALGSAAALGLDPGERWLCALPLAHVGGLSIVVRSAIYATTAVVHPRFDTGAVLRELSERPTTLVSLVATTLARLLDAGLREPPALRVALLGGGPVPDPLLARASAAGVPVAQTYGMTEACSQITTSLPGEPGTAGRPLVCTQVSTAPDGEILVRGATVAPGALASDGWLHTGDLGELDARGRLRVVGRKADTIVSGGENVAPAEVEAVLLAHPAVAEAAVHGRADAEWGEAVVATVVLAEGASADAAELRAHCAAGLAGYKVPKDFAFAASLPRTASGKLLRRELVGS